MTERSKEEQEMLAMLDNPALLHLYGYELTPRGAMVLVLAKELDYTIEKAEALALKMEDTIFKLGYITLHESQVELTNPREQPE